LQYCGSSPRDDLSPVGALEASASSKAASVTVGDVLTMALSRGVASRGAGMLEAPECANERTRRRPSPVGVSDGAWMPGVFRVCRPLLPSIGLDESTPV
jgi:hypothetical protein